MSPSDLAELPFTGKWVRYSYSAVHGTSGDSDEEDVNGIYVGEGAESSTSSESEIDSDFDDCGEDPHPPKPKCNLLHEVGSLLDGKDIGNALFGETALSIMGVPIIPRCVAFMIADHQIDQAAQVLREAQYPECKDLDQFAANPGTSRSQIRCNALTGGARGAASNRPIPAHHFHTDCRYPKDADDSRNQTRGVFLYRASQVLAPGIPMPPSRTPLPGNRYYRVTSDARLYRPSFEDENPMLNCLGRQSRKSYPVKMLCPVQYLENLVYLMVRDIGYSVFNGWETEFKCMLAFSRLLGALNKKVATINVDLCDVQEEPISDMIELHRGGGRNQAAIFVHLAALHRQGKKSGRLGEPLMTPREARMVKPEHIENCLKNMEEGKPPFPDEIDESGWTCPLM